MDVVRGARSAPDPRRARRARRPLAAGLQRQPRRRLPDRDRHPRPRLGRARPALAGRSWRRCAQTGIITDVDSDYQVGMPEVRVIPDRNKAADLGDQHGRRSARPSTPPSAACAWASSRRAAGATTSACACSARSASGRRTSSACSCARQAAQLVRLGDIVRIEQQPTLQAITRKDRERAITIFANVARGRLAGRGAATRRSKIARERAARGLPRHPLRQQPGLPGVVRVPAASPS